MVLPGPTLPNSAGTDFEAPGAATTSAARAATSTGLILDTVCRPRPAALLVVFVLCPHPARRAAPASRASVGAVVPADVDLVGCGRGHTRVERPALLKAYGLAGTAQAGRDGVRALVDRGVALHAARVPRRAVGRIRVRRVVH